MSAQPIPVHVMRTLIVLTLTVLTSVLVNKDSLEMEQLAKVCQNVPITHFAMHALQRKLNVEIEITQLFIISLNQMSMSVPRIRVLVTRTLIVPTVTAFIAALVNKDSLEMVHFAKVWKSMSFNTRYRRVFCRFQRMWWKCWLNQRWRFLQLYF